MDAIEAVRGGLSGIGGVLGGVVGTVLGGAALWGGFKLAKSYLPGMVAGWIGKEIDLILTAGDPDDDELVLAVLKWVESKVGPGKGEEKAKLAADKLGAMVAGMKGREDELRVIIQAVFDKSREVIHEKREPPQKGP